MTYKFWLTTEIKFLRDHIKTMPLNQIAEHLNRTELGVISKAYELGIQPTQQMKHWSTEDLHIVQTLPWTSSPPSGFASRYAERTGLPVRYGQNI